MKPSKIRSGRPGDLSPPPAKLPDTSATGSKVIVELLETEITYSDQPLRKSRICLYLRALDRENRGCLVGGGKGKTVEARRNCWLASVHLSWRLRLIAGKLRSDPIGI
jgi:hypothetical protein